MCSSPKRFRGRRDSTASTAALVLVEDTTTGGVLGPLVHRVRYSPTGLNWGYDGAGPRDLARSLLAAVLGDVAHCPICGGNASGCESCIDGLRRDLPDAQLVRDVVARLGQEWTLDEQQLRHWWHARLWPPTRSEPAGVPSAVVARPGRLRQTPGVASRGSWPYDSLVTYHGVIVNHPIGDGPGEDGPGVVAVELAEFGPTERQTTVELYKLVHPKGRQFSWGYTGGGPGSLADALLADCLGVEPPTDLRFDFVMDVLSQLPNEWRLRRSAVMRWVRGWLADRPSQPRFEALDAIPPADHMRYEDPPENLPRRRLEASSHED